MKWTDQLLNGTIVLNQKAAALTGKQVGITVHYWGAQAGHLNNKPHKHSFFEVCYILDGSGSYLENENEYALKRGVLFMSRPHVMHQIRSDRGLDIIFVGFELNGQTSDEASRNLFNALSETETFYVPEAQDLPIVRLWTSLLLTANEYQPLFADSIESLCTSVITGLERVFNDQSRSVRENPKVSIAAMLVYQAKLYIRDNLSQPLKLDDVAGHLLISGRHLSRVFLSELGQSFSSYVRKERIRKAGILLTNTDLSIKEISEQTGFDTVHYFTSVFAKEMGMPPARFKKKFKQLHS
jgi:AraC-type DNA-binding domain-containing proteins